MADGPGRGLWPLNAVMRRIIESTHISLVLTVGSTAVYRCNEKSESTSLSITVHRLNVLLIIVLAASSIFDHNYARKSPAETPLGKNDARFLI